MAKAVLTSWGGINMQHRYEDLSLIRDVIREHRPLSVVELGTDSGGFAAFLADTVREWDGQVLTVDITPKCPPAVFAGRENLRFAAIDALQPSSLIRDWLSGPHVTMLYCDNGHKERELELWAPYLPVGGLLGCHDYIDEVRPEFAEPLLASLGYRQERHAEFEALAHPIDYPVSMTRFWVRA